MRIFKGQMIVCCAIVCFAACKNLPLNKNQVGDVNQANTILLSENGGDRATAYTMNNKIVWLPEGLLCTWIDKNHINQWALIDHTTNKLVREGNIGGVMPDNHCGAALAKTPDGSVHAVIGGHHSTLYHYKLEDVTRGNWMAVDSIEAQATYPSLVANSQGELYLAFRQQQDTFWTIDFAKFENDRWTSPKPLVVASKPGYVYWTNSLAVSTDNTIHMLLANVQLDPTGFEKGTLYHGASYLFSLDGGEHWQSSDNNPVEIPAKVDNMSLVEGSYDPDRVASVSFLEKYDAQGPTSKEYLQIQLSNLVVDQRGVAHFLYHNGLRGTVELMSLKENEWQSIDLVPFIEEHYQGVRVHMQSSLKAKDSRLLAAIKLEPTGENVWGAAGTFTVVLSIEPGKSEVREVFSTGRKEDIAQWLPAFIHDQYDGTNVSGMLYTEGANAGGFQNNQNEIATKVWLVKF
ncbi:BNR-4 repeat-containing protein [Tunicatimonas pelagia]|uniref:BNR-4 repeat-containing protein n=1 Tax=Tunicatimonas pelagia TaxID=931531 RepID=UPI002666274E|nr:BNR-4 repeat-containing protein [Tunicatimonas pelagia]WKN45462.1 BNR-4 repeat-containing protein [Tunicatimonas pelagia]